MKGEKTLQLLKLIGNSVGKIISDAYELNREYSILLYRERKEIYRQIKIEKRSLNCADRGRVPEDMQKKLNRFRVLVSRLKKDGLIKQEGIGKQISLTLTSLGIETKKELERRLGEGLPNISHYHRTAGEKTTLIIFDIPEKEKHKRQWLRIAIEALGFSMLQKSVWIGRVQLPRDFLIDLKNLNLLMYVHIFTVTKKGTLIF